MTNRLEIPVATFVIPEICWAEHYFAPCHKAQEDFLKKYPGNETVEDLIYNQRREEVLYNKYKAFYGYVFYIGRKI